MFPYRRDFITFTKVSSRRATASCTHRALRRLPSTLSRPLAHVVSPPSPHLLPDPPLPEPQPTHKTQLHLNLLPPRFELLMMRQEDVHPTSRAKTKLTVVSSCTPPNRCLKKRHRKVRLSVADDQASRTSFQASDQTFECLHVLGVWLLHSSRKFFHRELQLTPVLTEVTCTHRPRSATRTILSVKLLATTFFSHRDTWRTHSFAFLRVAVTMAIGPAECHWSRMPLG